MRVRIKHAKVNKLAFLSHLDLVATMQKALRRTGLPFALTKGFNPRPKIAYGQPVAVGTASLAEYFDLYLDKSLEEKVIIKGFRRVLPKELRVLAAKEIPSENPSLMSQITAAAHYLWIRGCDVNKASLDFDSFFRSLSEKNGGEAFLPQNNFTNPGSLILKIDWLGWREDFGLLRIIAKAGSRENLNMKKFCESLDKVSNGLFKGPCCLMKTEIFIVDRGTLKTPFGLEVNF